MGDLGHPPEPAGSNANVPKRVQDNNLKEDCANKIESGEWVVDQKGGRGLTSAVWMRFGVVRDVATKKAVGFAQCFQCKLIKIFKCGSSTTSLQKHKCVAPVPAGDLAPTQTQVTADMKENFKNACVDYCAGNLMPFCSVSGENFENLVQTAVDMAAEKGRFEVKSLVSTAKTISKATTKRANEICDNCVLPQVREAAEQGLCAATTDMWTESYKHTHLVTLTTHWIDEEFKLCSSVLFTEKFPVGVSESGENIQEVFDEKFEKLELPYKKITFTTDGGANLVKFSKLAEVERLYCMAHCLNVVLKTTFTMKLVDVNLYSAPSAKLLVDDITVAVLLIHATKSEKKLAKSLILPPHSDGSSRIFKSKVPFLKTVSCHFEEIQNSLRKCCSEEALKNVKKEDIDAIINFMEPIEKAAKLRKNSLEGVDISWLRTHIEDVENDTPFMREVKEHVRRELSVITIIQLLAKLSRVVTYFKHSGLMELLPLSLKQEIDPRWNSHLLMLLSFPRNFSKINEELQTRKREDLVLSEEEQTQIESLIDFLTIFKEESDFLEADKVPTLQRVLLAHRRLIYHCGPTAKDTEGMAKLRAKTLKLLEEKFVPHRMHKLATCLWPDFKYLPMFSEEEREEVYSFARTLCEELNPHRAESLLDPPPKRQKTTDNYDFWRKPDTAPEERQDDVSAYLASNTGHCDSTDLLQWWKSMANRYPRLAKVARKALAIPATSASSERAFSTAGLVLNARRVSLSPASVDSLIFLHKYNKQQKSDA